MSCTTHATRSSQHLTPVGPRKRDLLKALCASAVLLAGCNGGDQQQGFGSVPPTPIGAPRPPGQFAGPVDNPFSQGQFGQGQFGQGQFNQTSQFPAPFPGQFQSPVPNQGFGGRRFVARIRVNGRLVGTVQGSFTPGGITINGGGPVPYGPGSVVAQNAPQAPEDTSRAASATGSAGTTPGVNTANPAGPVATGTTGSTGIDGTTDPIATSTAPPTGAGAPGTSSVASNNAPVDASNTPPALIPNSPDVTAPGQA